MFEKEYEASAHGAAAKVRFLEENPLGYVMVSLLGGAYLGFGHCIANMTLMDLALMAPHPDTINVAHYFYNLCFVTAGNVAGAIFFVSIPYGLASRHRA